MAGRTERQLTNIDTPWKFLKKRLTAKKTGFMGINRKSSFLFWGVVVVWGNKSHRYGVRAGSSRGGFGAADCV